MNKPVQPPAKPATGTEPSHLKAYAGVVTAIFMWSLGMVLVRGFHEHIPPLGLSFWRWLISALVVLPMVWPALKRHHKLIWKHFGLLVLLGGLMVGSGTILFVALNLTATINAGLVNAAQPSVTALMAWMLVRERLTGLQVLGIVLAVTGVGLMVTRADLDVLSRLDFNVGDLIMIGAIIGYSLYAIRLRRLPPEIGTLPSLFVMIFAGAMLLLPLHIYEALYIRPMPVDLTTVGLIAFLALFVSIAPLTLWNKGIVALGPNRCAVFVNLIPVFGAAMAITFLGEQLFAYHIAGTILVATGIFLVVRPGRKPHGH